MLVGVLADTHIPQRLKVIPQAVLGLFQGVDLILHAGDLVAPYILGELAQIAPVKAVRGNVHLMDRTMDAAQLPSVERLDLLGHGIILIHGHGSFLQGSWERVRFWLGRDRDAVNQRIARWCLESYPEAEAIIFGHSHRVYHRCIGGVLLFNPGAVCPTRGERPSVGLLTVEREKVSAQVVELT